MVVWLDDQQQLAWRNIVRFVALFQARLEADLAVGGVTMDDYEILVNLSEAGEEGLRMTDLAAMSHIPKSRLTYRFDRLVDRGIAVREDCPQDRRGCVARLTEEGRQFMGDLAPVHVASVRAAIVDRLSYEEFIRLGEQLGTILSDPESGFPEIAPKSLVAPVAERPQ
jgi:DNA-binding MarR family transcriptional regulator